MYDIIYKSIEMMPKISNYPTKFDQTAAKLKACFAMKLVRSDGVAFTNLKSARQQRNSQIYRCYFIRYKNLTDSNIIERFIIFSYLL